MSGAERDAMRRSRTTMRALLKGMAQRSAERRKRIVGNVARNFAEAEQWDLEFWQSQTPAMRLSALVALRNDLAAIHGRNRDFDWDD